MAREINLPFEVAHSKEGDFLRQKSLREETLATEKLSANIQASLPGPRRAGLFLFF